MVTVDLDGVLVIAHSDKEDATPTWKRTYGHHPGPGGPACRAERRRMRPEYFGEPGVYGEELDAGDERIPSFVGSSHRLRQDRRPLGRRMRSRSRRANPSYIACAGSRWWANGSLNTPVRCEYLQLHVLVKRERRQR